MPKNSISLDIDPWRGLPTRVADLIEGEIDPIAEEIVDEIAAAVPEYARPLEGRLGEGIRRGVGEALRQFVALIRDPEAGRGEGAEVYRELGRGEQRAGRTLDSLQAAYRVGARVSWRRFAAACRRGRVGTEALALLAEAVFAYIDEVAADSVEGYAEAQAEVEDLRRRRRRELVELLLADPPADTAEIGVAARAASWEVPGRLAALACPEEALSRVALRLPPEALATVVGGEGCVLLPDPEGPGREKALARAAEEGGLVIGPTVTPSAAAESWALASALARAERDGVMVDRVSDFDRDIGRGFGPELDRAPGSERTEPRPETRGSRRSAGRRDRRPAPRRSGLLRVDENLATLLLLESRDLAGRIADRRLAPLADLTPKARARMRETALAHVRNDGNAVAMAAEMHVHPQTARYRIARLRELLGSQLDDPDARFELQLALRAEALAA